MQSEQVSKERYCLHYCLVKQRTACIINVWGYTEILPTWTPAQTQRNESIWWGVKQNKVCLVQEHPKISSKAIYSNGCGVSTMETVLLQKHYQAYRRLQHMGLNWRKEISGKTTPKDTMKVSNNFISLQFTFITLETQSLTRSTVYS